MKLGITYELNTRMKFTTLAPEKELRMYGRFYHKAHKMYHINYCDITYSHSVSRTAARGSRFMQSLTKFFM
jgi:hypothetical protein